VSGNGLSPKEWVTAVAVILFIVLLVTVALTFLDAWSVFL